MAGRTEIQKDDEVGSSRYIINMGQSNELIAVCGLDCSACDIYTAASNHSIAVDFADWLKAERHIEVKPEDVCCLGCRGSREKHWSPDCWILECCVDKKGLNYCFECQEFPCSNLIEWSKSDPGYTKALERLNLMKKERNN
jgi:hypothetical protein